MCVHLRKKRREETGEGESEIQSKEEKETGWWGCGEKGVETNRKMSLCPYSLQANHPKFVVCLLFLPLRCLSLHGVCIQVYAFMYMLNFKRMVLYSCP